MKINFNVRRNTSDVDIFYEVFKSKDYSFEHVSNAEIKTIVDIGAHIGCFTVKALEHFKSARCISYEPAKENFRYLCANTINYINRCDVINCSVSGDRLPTELESSNLVFENGKINTGSNIFKYEKTDKEVKNNIHIKTIQKEIDYIDILKIDCEGGENSIFENIDFTRIKYIYCELHEYGSLIGNNNTMRLIQQNNFKILYHKRLNDKIQNFIAVNMRGGSYE